MKPKQEVIPQNKQKISLRQVVRLIAKEQAKRYISKLPLLQYRDNLEELEERLVAENLEHLNNYINDNNFFCKPFLYAGEEKLINNSSLFLVDWVYECGYRAEIELYETDIKENLLSFTPEQREHCYILSHGRIQNFRVAGKNIILEEILNIDDIIPEEPNPKPVKPRVSKKEKIAAISKRLDCITEELAVIQRAIKDI